MKTDYNRCAVYLKICGKANLVLKLKYNNQTSMEFHNNAINGTTSEICVVYLTLLSF